MLVVSDTTANYELVRSTRRKTLSIQIRHGQVRVLAPAGVEASYIDELVQQKSAWITAKLKAQQGICLPARRFEHGETFYYRGHPHALVITRAKSKAVHLDAGQIHVKVPESLADNRVSDYVEKHLAAWYKGQANLELPQRLAYFSDVTGLKPTALKIRRYKARWGSCDNKGGICLNWLLMMVPDTVIDYVIIHELCHLKHLNHSRQFWTLVNRFYPDAADARQWLKQHQSALVWQ